MENVNLLVEDLKVKEIKDVLNKELKRYIVREYSEYRFTYIASMGKMIDNLLLAYGDRYVNDGIERQCRVIVAGLNESVLLDSKRPTDEVGAKMHIDAIMEGLRDGSLKFPPNHRGLWQSSSLIELCKEFNIYPKELKLIVKFRDAVSAKINLEEEMLRPSSIGLQAHCAIGKLQRTPNSDNIYKKVSSKKKPY